jgi:phosphoenolpyruvate-protein phosphotransferase (PTS system enzyme I)
MNIQHGIPVSPGIAMAEVVVLGSDEFQTPHRAIGRGEVEAELRRFHRAIAQATREIDEEVARFDKGFELPLQILESHRNMLHDPALRAAVEKVMRTDSLSAETSLSRVLEGYYRRFEQLESEYISERAQDLREIERKLLRILLGKRPRTPHRFSRPVVVIAHNLTPSETATLDKEKVVGFAIDVGGRTSHTAIVARALQIPAVVGLKSISGGLSGGEMVIIDGYSGLVIVDPDRKTQEEYRSKAVTHRAYYQSLVKEIRLPVETVDGHEIVIGANIEFPEEIHTALEWGAAGVGLYRTEFLFDDKPLDEERHYRTYKSAVKLLRDRHLVIRTMDLGADKSPLPGLGSERNPFLGFRSIRLSLEYPEMFTAQVRAIFRASSHGNVRLMLPMVSNLEELRKAKELIRGVRESMERERLEFDPRLEIGIMVEVPSVAVMADEFAAEVDFFSIGTNDLIQYALAVDRVNERVAHLYQPSHPAVLRLIKMVIDAGRRKPISVSCCGEMVGEPIYALLFMGLGLRRFSVSPIAIPILKRAIRAVTMREAVEIAETCLKFESAKDSLEFLEKRLAHCVTKLW